VHVPADRQVIVILAQLLGLLILPGAVFAETQAASSTGAGSPVPAPGPPAATVRTIEPTPEPATDLPDSLTALLPELTLQSSQISAYVRRVDAEQPLLSVNADTARVPASVAKLITSIAALDLLGPDYQWRTEVLISGDVVAGTLEGDLVIKGYGDPFISTESYAALIRAVRAKGIRHIDGNLYLDNSHLVPPDAERGDFDGAAQRSYNALPAALSLNRQVTFVHLFNDRERGGVGVYTEPPLTGLEIVNTATVVEAPCKGRYHRLSVKFSEPEPRIEPQTEPPLETGPMAVDELAGGGPRLTVSGRFASECADERIPRLILSPERHAAAAFDALWREAGGSINGRVVAAPVPEDTRVFHTAYSRPLQEVLRTVNKWSDNLMARMVFLALGVEQAGPPGSVQTSRDALSLWLSAGGFDAPELFIDNGSGLSRDTRMSAATVGELLAWAYHRPWMPELMASMAIMGVDGTLATRMRKEAIEGRAHMKTGTVRDASCIAGYVLDPEGKRWVVVVLVNARPGERLAAWHGHAVHHSLLRWVMDGAAPP
jgi:D-alanyl-D-alanine carboxypeptidase/D-alanyl-D-alanine-endopeptidase (penicillin-binding protein 4)